MGLLDGLLGNVLGSALNGVLGGGQTNQAAQALDPKAALIQGVLGMLMNSGNAQSAGGSAAGLGGLLEAFSQNGMAEQVGSWIGTGQNLPINADQISQVLGSLGGAGGSTGIGDVLGQLAGSTGLSRDDAASQLSELLPNIVDKLTPHGQVPDASNLGDLGGLMQQLLGK